MRNNKNRVFLAARKRGLSVKFVRNFLIELNAPPTLKEKPAQRETVDSRPIGPIRTIRLPTDYRDIDDNLAKIAVDLICKEYVCTNSIAYGAQRYHQSLIH